MTVFPAFIPSTITVSLDDSVDSIMLSLPLCIFHFISGLPAKPTEFTISLQKLPMPTVWEVEYE